MRLRDDTVDGAYRPDHVAEDILTDQSVLMVLKYTKKKSVPQLILCLDFCFFPAQVVSALQK